MYNLIDSKKVNGTNTWDFQLIDYFADMTCLKQGCYLLKRTGY